MWFSLKYAAPNDYQIRISLGGETKKIKVLVSDPKTSLAKSPNPHCETLYTIWQANFSVPERRVSDFELGDCKIADLRLQIADWRL